MLLKTGQGLGGGGGLCGNCGVNHPNFEIFSPPYLFNPNGSRARRPVIRSAPASFRPGTTLQVRMDSNEPHTFALMKLSAATHAVNNDMRRVPLRVASRSGGLFRLQTSRNAAVLPPGDYFLFAMNSRGVPSIASTIRVARRVRFKPLNTECRVFNRRISYHIISRNSGKALNVEGSSQTRAANIEQRTVGASSRPSDQFRIQSSGFGGFNRIIAVHSGQAVTVHGSSREAGANINQWPVTPPASNQEWCFVDIGGGYYNIRSRRSGLFLDIFGRSTEDGGNLIQWNGNGQTNQQWRVVPV